METDGFDAFRELTVGASQQADISLLIPERKRRTILPLILTLGGLVTVYGLSR